MLGTLLSISLSLTALDAPQDGHVLEILPLQHVCGPRASLTPPRWGTMLTFGQISSDSDRPNLVAIPEGGPRFQPESAVDMLRSLHRDEVDANQLRLEALGDSLIVAGEAARVATVREQVRDLSALLARQLHVEAAVWDASAGDAPAAILGPQEFAQFTANRTPLWRSGADGYSGGAVALDGQRWTRYVRDNSTEVAQKITISNPLTNAFCEGGRIVAVPHELLGGDDLVLHVQFGWAQRRGSVRVVPTGVSGQADLELPQLETIYGACSGRIANGGALAVTLRGHASSGGQFVLTVRAAGKTPPPPRLLAGLGVFPCGALMSMGLSHRVTPPWPYPTIADQEQPQMEINDISGGYGQISEDMLVDLMRTSLGADVAEEVQIRCEGGWMFASASSTVLQKAESLLRALQERLLTTTSIHHSGNLDTVDGAAAHQVLHEFVLPTLVGRDATVCRILETNFVRDLFVEIAQEAAVLNPEVDLLQSGTWLRVRTAPLGQDHHLQLTAQSVHAPVPQPRGVVPAGGILMTPEVGVTRAIHDSAAVNGQTIDHGNGPSVQIDGRAFRSTLTTVVRW